MQTFHISPRKITRWLLVVAIGLTIISFMASLAQHLLGTTAGGLTDRLNVGIDSSVPTWFASFLLFIVALLLGFIAYVKKQRRAPYVNHWGFLSLLFLYISVDEVATLRESTGVVARSFVSTSGMFYYNWVIVAIPFIIFVSLAYFKFFMNLPKHVRNLLGIGAACYVMGGLGLEMLAALVHSSQGVDNLFYSTVTTVEELLEMVGVIIMLYSLMLYIRTENIQGVQFYVETSPINQPPIKVNSERK